MHFTNVIKDIINAQAKIDLKSKEIIITNHCDTNVDHNILNLEQFEKLYNNNDLKN